MKERIRIEGVIDTVAHAQTIKDNVVANLAGRDIFEQHELDHYVDPDTGNVWFRAELRFNGSFDRGDFRDWIRDQIETHPQVKTWFLGARITTHQCVHDGSYDLAIPDHTDAGEHTDGAVTRPHVCSGAEVVVWERGVLVRTPHTDVVHADHTDQWTDHEDVPHADVHSDTPEMAP